MKNTVIPLTEEMRQFYWRLKSTSPFMIGYPGNLGNDFTELFKFFDFLINNCGDPNEIGSYQMDSKEYENRVLKFFGDVYKFEKFWGYLTSGGTEGNLMGLLMGRIKYPKGIVYSSDSGHYSIRKNTTILNVPCKEIKSLYGEIDYENLHYHLLKEKTQPILNLTIGTTFDGATDSIDKL